MEASYEAAEEGLPGNSFRWHHHASLFALKAFISFPESDDAQCNGLRYRRSLLSKRKYCPY